MNHCAHILVLCVLALVMMNDALVPRFDKRYVADLTFPDLLAKVSSQCARVNCRFKNLMIHGKRGKRRSSLLESYFVCC